MTNGNPVSLQQLDSRIAIVRDNIRQLIEQAAGFSGAGDEARNAERIAQQQAELDRLRKERDILAKALKQATPKPPAKRKKRKQAKSAKKQTRRTARKKVKKKK